MPTSKQAAAAVAATAATDALAGQAAVAAQQAILARQSAAAAAQRAEFTYLAGLPPNRRTVAQNNRLAVFLGTAPRTQRAGPTALHALSTAVQVIEVPRGGTVYRINEPTDGFYVVVDGRVALYDVKDRDESEEDDGVVERLGRTDSFGEEDLLSGSRRAHRADVGSDGSAILLRVTPELYRKYLQHLHQPDFEDKVSFLAQLEVFRSLPEDTLRRLAPCYMQVELRAKEYLVRQGERADSMYAIASGQCSVLVDPNFRAETGGVAECDPKKAMQVCLIGPGNIVGDMTVLANVRKRTASILTLTDLVAYKIRRATFVRRVPSVQLEALRQVAEAKLRITERRLHSAAAGPGGGGARGPNGAPVLLTLRDKILHGQNLRHLSQPPGNVGPIELRGLGSRSLNGGVESLLANSLAAVMGGGGGVGGGGGGGGGGYSAAGSFRVSSSGGLGAGHSTTPISPLPSYNPGAVVGAVPGVGGGAAAAYSGAGPLAAAAAISVASMSTGGAYGSWATGGTSGSWTSGVGEARLRFSGPRKATSLHVLYSQAGPAAAGGAGPAGGAVPLDRAAARARGRASGGIATGVRSQDLNFTWGLGPGTLINSLLERPATTTATAKGSGRRSYPSDPQSNGRGGVLTSDPGDAPEPAGGIATAASPPSATAPDGAATATTGPALLPSQPTAQLHPTPHRQPIQHPSLTHGRASCNATPNRSSLLSLTQAARMSSAATDGGCALGGESGPVSFSVVGVGVTAIGSTSSSGAGAHVNGGGGGSGGYGPRRDGARPGSVSFLSGDRLSTLLEPPQHRPNPNDLFVNGNTAAGGRGASSGTPLRPGPLILGPPAPVFVSSPPSTPSATSPSPQPPEAARHSPPRTPVFRAGTAASAQESLYAESSASVTAAAAAAAAAVEELDESLGGLPVDLRAVSYSTAFSVAVSAASAAATRPTSRAASRGGGSCSPWRNQGGGDGDASQLQDQRWSSMDLDSGDFDGVGGEDSPTASPSTTPNQGPRGRHSVVQRRKSMGKARFGRKMVTQNSSVDALVAEAIVSTLARDAMLAQTRAAEAEVDAVLAAEGEGGGSGGDAVLLGDVGGAGAGWRRRRSGQEGAEGPAGEGWREGATAAEVEGYAEVRGEQEQEQMAGREQGATAEATPESSVNEGGDSGAPYQTDVEADGTYNEGDVGGEGDGAVDSAATGEPSGQLGQGARRKKEPLDAGMAEDESREDRPGAGGDPQCNQDVPDAAAPAVGGEGADAVADGDGDCKDTAPTAEASAPLSERLHEGEGDSPGAGAAAAAAAAAAEEEQVEGLKAEQEQGAADGPPDPDAPQGGRFGGGGRGISHGGSGGGVEAEGSDSVACSPSTTPAAEASAASVLSTSSSPKHHAGLGAVFAGAADADAYVVDTVATGPFRRASLSGSAALQRQASHLSLSLSQPQLHVRGSGLRESSSGGGGAPGGGEASHAAAAAAAAAASSAPSGGAIPRLPYIGEREQQPYAAVTAAAAGSGGGGSVHNGSSASASGGLAPVQRAISRQPTTLQLVLPDSANLPHGRQNAVSPSRRLTGPPAPRPYPYVGPFLSATNKGPYLPYNLGPGGLPATTLPKPPPLPLSASFGFRQSGTPPASAGAAVTAAAGGPLAAVDSPREPRPGSGLEAHLGGLGGGGGVGASGSGGGGSTAVPNLSRGQLRKGGALYRPASLPRSGVMLPPH